MRTPLEALEAAIRVLGSQQALADALGVRQPSISEWRQRGVIPEDRCEPIEALVAARWDHAPDEVRAEVGEPVRVEELRPELGWERDARGFVVGIVRAIEPIAPRLTADAGEAGSEAAHAR